MSFASLQTIFHPSRDVTGVDVFSSTTSEYSALIISSSVQLGGRDVVFAAVYGQFDVDKIGGSANIPSPDAMPDPTKQIVYYKGDEGQAFFANPQGPPPCSSFTHCIYVFDVQNNVISIQGKTGVAYTISLLDATKISMQDLVTPALWCKSVPLASSARSTDSTTTNNWILGIIIAIAVLMLFFFVFANRSSPIQRRKHEFASPLRALGNTPRSLQRRNREVLLNL
jgi:hypothetical protein